MWTSTSAWPPPPYVCMCPLLLDPLPPLLWTSFMDEPLKSEKWRVIYNKYTHSMLVESAVLRSALKQIPSMYISLMPKNWNQKLFKSRALVRLRFNTFWKNAPLINYSISIGGTYNPLVRYHTIQELSNYICSYRHVQKCVKLIAFVYFFNFNLNF